MKAFVFSLRIVPEKWVEFYRNPKANIIATTLEGRRVQFAAKHVQKFVTRDGVSGVFKLTIDDNNDFVNLEALDR